MTRYMRNSGRQRGLTLIELMVAMVLGLLVVAGIITVFLSTSASVKAQDQLATLQEAGRYAMARLSDDLGMANAQYCSGSGGNARPTTPGPSLDDLRAPKVFASVFATDLADTLPDVTTDWGTPYPAAPTRAFAIPDYLFMRGYDCDKDGNCNPVDPKAITGIPEQGKTVGDRVVGTSVLTLRYLDSSMGWSIGYPSGSEVVAAAGGSSIDVINLKPLAGEPPVTDFAAGDLAMLADCSLAEVFAVNGQGTAQLVPQAAPANFEQPGAMTGTQALRLFDFNKAFKTVTYWVRVVDAGNGRTSGALMRRINGTDEELVRGIERLDFRYGVMADDGTTRFLTADAVDSATNCPWKEPDDAVEKGNRIGCLWRAVQSIEVDFLMDGQTPLHSLNDADLAYTYAGDGATTPLEPQDHKVQPDVDQGFDKPLLRREFTALVAVRNYNP